MENGDSETTAQISHNEFGSTHPKSVTCHYDVHLRHGWRLGDWRKRRSSYVDEADNMVDSKSLESVLYSSRTSSSKGRRGQRKTNSKKCAGSCETGEHRNNERGSSTSCPERRQGHRERRGSRQETQRGRKATALEAARTGSKLEEMEQRRRV